ncbi:centrosomal protein of 131 kDa-like [Saccostrea echinata]|uniref:centrosomal protein of 131 kDa-like n=1 Tax=Saccostrea echinata TaxID=191078 RepID=UPI002A825714|nr:centrosomal protein of 131 kDa-like [Saccostrea echinata]
MSARSHGDDLSLTGSQISTRSSLKKSSSARQLNRPSSASSVKTQLGDGAKSESVKRNTFQGQGNISQRSDLSSVSKKSTGKGKSPGEDFLALFESSIQPKIKAPAAKSKKPGPNAVKVLWQQPPKKSPSDIGMNGDGNISPSPVQNVFQRHTYRSTDDESDEDILSSSYSKIQALQQLQAQKQKPPSPGDILGNLDALVRIKSPTGNKDISDDVTGIHKQNVPSSKSSSVTRASKGANNSVPSSSGIANNMVVKGKSPRTSFTSIENSYQNIKHKMPVNQVKERHINSGASNTQTSVGRNIAEDYIQTLNSAATKIQRYYRKYRQKNVSATGDSARQKAGAAALKRLMQQKRQEVRDSHNKLDLSLLSEEDSEKKKIEDRKKTREEKARQARLQAIQDLHKKREEKREEIKRKAEEEVSYLQASGKITKTPYKTNLGKKKPDKTKKETNKEKDDSASEPASSSRSLPQSSQSAISSARTVSTLRGDQTDSELESASNVQQVDTNGLDSNREPIPGSEAGTKSTLNDLLETLKKLEEEEHLEPSKPERKNAWLDEIDKELDNSNRLTEDRLRELGQSKDGPSHKESYLSDDKLRSIMSFLDEVQVSDRISAVEQELNKVSQDFEIPPPLVPSADELADLENAQAAANEVTSTVLSQRLDLEEKKRTITMLQKALSQQRELTIRHARETEKEMKKRLDVQKDEYEETIKRHLSFIDQLIDDKKNLSEKCEMLVKELKTVDKKYQDKIKTIEEKHAIDVQKIKDMHEAAEKLRRERWIQDKTKKIKEMTVQGLEPEIQRLIAKHKNEIKKIKQIHEAEILESDERAAQRYVRMTEELRDQLAKEKEAACARERELAKQRYEKELQNEEEAYQQQRRRLYQEVQEEKERVSQQASRQRTELDKLQRQLEDSHALALAAMKSEFEKAREEQENRHNTEIRELKERLAVEKASWEENYMKKQETWMLQKERELKDQVRRDRDKEIEFVISRLEEDATASREETEKAADNKIRRIREKYELEMKDLERSEQQALEKYNEMKARLTEVSGENECLVVKLNQKDQEIENLQELTDKMHRERDRVSDIIRQEFADRLVATDEENKRVKNEMSEMKARHRIELDRCKEQIEDVRKQKDEEMEEVHKRVKQAIVKKEDVVTQLREQYSAAQKRADHLEGLLQQQRKQLLGKK